jgi:hypothetical protein
MERLLAAVAALHPSDTYTTYTADISTPNKTQITRTCTISNQQAEQNKAVGNGVLMQAPALPAPVALEPGYMQPTARVAENVSQGQARVARRRLKDSNNKAPWVVAQWSEIVPGAGTKQHSSYSPAAALAYMVSQHNRMRHYIYLELLLVGLCGGIYVAYQEAFCTQASNVGATSVQKATRPPPGASRQAFYQISKGKSYRVFRIPPSGSPSAQDAVTSLP